MIKYFLQSIYIALTLLTLVSCEEMKQDMTFNKDGSGEMQFTLKLGGEMMDMMMGAFGEGADSVDAEEPSKSFIDETRDTTMNFFELVPEDIRNGMDQPELLKNWIINMKMDEETQTMTFEMDVPFRSIEELKEVMIAMSQADNVNNSGGEMSMSQMSSMIDTSFQWEPGHIHLGGNNLSDFPEYEEMMAEMGSEENEEMMAMMAMMFGDATFDLTITAPGEIYRCDCPFGEVHGNQLVISYKLAEMFENLEAYAESTDIYYKE